MTTPVDDVARDLYDQLTTRTFYVVDTEFCTHAEDHHLISIAVVPVVGGRRVQARQELYRVMNPGVPIDEATSAVHGFTDDDVAGKPGFDAYAAVIAARLADPDAVFVSHTTIDAHVLGSHMRRLAATGGKGRARPALPDLPVLDTQRLVTVLGYPGVTARTRASLDTLCDLTGVARSSTAHDAREDARATANALIAMLRRCAGEALFWSVEDILDAGSGGTLHQPSGPSRIKPRTKRRTAVPADHLARHAAPLAEPVPAGSEQAEQWLDMAAECAAVRCPHLRDEARLAAVNGAVLLRPLMDDLPHLVEPGQPGTLLGAVHELLTAQPGPGAGPALPADRALQWWRSARPLIAASTSCVPGSTDRACPSCREGQPCPRDVLRIAVAEIATLGEGRALDQARRDRMLKRTPKSPLNTWRKHHPDVLAYALWRIATSLAEEDRDEHATTPVDTAITFAVHDKDPRMALMACERTLETTGADAAFALADRVLASRSTDPGYDDLADWVLFTRNALYAQQPARPRTITHPRLARPAGHTHPRLYT
jgi:DNA polymerase III epsilon subunit-like protein